MRIEAVLGWDRTEAASCLSTLLQADGLSIPDQPALLDALDLYGRIPQLDFPGAYLASTVLLRPAAVASFDREFDAINGIQRVAS